MKNFSGVCQAAGADKPLRAFFHLDYKHSYFIDVKHYHLAANLC